MLLAEPSGKFLNFCRMSSEDFELILTKYGPKISKQNTNMRKPNTKATKCVYRRAARSPPVYCVYTMVICSRNKYWEVRTERNLVIIGAIRPNYSFDRVSNTDRVLLSWNCNRWWRVCLLHNRRTVHVPFVRYCGQIQTVRKILDEDDGREALDRI